MQNVPSIASQPTDVLSEALQLFETGQHDAAEHLLADAIRQARERSAVSDEAGVRIALATVLKYKGDFTRAFAELEPVLGDPSLSLDLLQRARTLEISLNFELGRYDRVERLAGELQGVASPLAFTALAHFKAGRFEEGCAVVQREIALAERAGSTVRALKKRYELSMWRILPLFRPGTEPAPTLIAAALSVFDDCEVGLTEIGDTAARSELVRLRQRRAVVMQAAERAGAGEDELRREVAARSGAGKDASHVLAAFLVARAERGEVAAAFEAEPLIDEMWTLLEGEAPGGLARAAHLAARNDRQLGRATGDPNYFRRALTWLRKADQWLSGMRRRYREPGVEMTDATRRAMQVGTEDIYLLAVHILLKDLLSPTEAFEWGQRYKGNVLTETIATGPLPAPSTLPPDVVAEERQLLAQLHRAGSHAETWAAQTALEQIWERLSESSEGQEYVVLRRGMPPRYSDLQSAIGQVLTVVEFVAIGDQLLAFGIRPEWDEPAVQILPVKLSTLRRDILQATGNPRSMLRDVLARPSVAACIAPLVSWTNPNDVICVIPAGPLFYLPFHAVPVDGLALIARNPVFYAPSASTLRYCLMRGAPSASGRDWAPAVFGDPTGDLPHAAEEAAAVAEILGVVPDVGAAVTHERWREAIATMDVIHFAGHAEFKLDDPLGSGLRLGGGEIITAREFFETSGSTLRLVTLSGCETGFNAVQPGDEVVGLTRALLSAGAASLILTLWQINDVTSATLMRRFYERWVGGESKVNALAGAQRDLIQAGHADPYYWAAFTLIGDWQ